MKRKKVLMLLLCCTMFLSGCTVQYSMSVNKDLSISEEGDVTQSISNLEKAYGNAEVGFQKYYNLTTRQYDLTGYTTNQYSDGRNWIANFIRDYKDIDEYRTNSLFYKNYGKDAQITEDGDTITFTMTAAYQLTYEESQAESPFKKIPVRVYVPFQVKEHNADVVEKDENLYIWNITLKEPSRDIKLVMQKNKAPKKEFSYYFEIALFLGIIVLGIGGFYIVSRQHRKNNRL